MSLAEWSCVSNASAGGYNQPEVQLSQRTAAAQDVGPHTWHQQAVTVPLADTSAELGVALHGRSELLQCHALVVLF